MQTDQLNGLIALKAVADRKNFRAAADALGISPSAISQAIKQLEHRLGVTLLSRTTRRTHLTEPGERFLAETGPALEQILTAIDNIGSYAKEPSGLLRLNMPRIIYPTLLAPVIADFSKKYPAVAIELFFDDGLSDVVETGFDAGIRLSEMMAQDMVGIRVGGPMRFVVAGSPQYFRNFGRPKRPKDLLVHRCIGLRLGKGRIYDRWEFETAGKEFQVHVKCAMILNDPVLALNAAVEGSGVTYCIAEMIEEKVRSQHLEIVLDRFASPSDGFYMYYPKRSQVLPKLRAFIDHLQESLAQR